MSDSNIASIGRFSSQMLTYLGTQKTVIESTGQNTNTFKYILGPTTFPEPGSISQSALGAGVVGSFPIDAYNSTKSYFTSRGASGVYADTMTAIAIDIATALGVSVQSLLEKSELFNKFQFSDDAYRMFNQLRDPSHQVGTVTTVLNKNSLQARSIRA